MSSKFKTPKEFQLLRAKRIAQELRTLEREGVLYATNPVDEITKAEYMVRFRRDLTWRINQKMPNANHRKVNAERAADVVLKGENSRWWFARDSTSHAGQDMRGIVHHVNKITKHIELL